MTDTYIAAAWILTFLIVGGYALALILRGRRLSRAVPAGNHRWMRAESGASVLGPDGSAGAVAADVSESRREGSR